MPKPLEPMRVRTRVRLQTLAGSRSSNKKSVCAFIGRVTWPLLTSSNTYVYLKRILAAADRIDSVLENRYFFYHVHVRQRFANLLSRGCWWSLIGNRLLPLFDVYWPSLLAVRLLLPLLLQMLKNTGKRNVEQEMKVRSGPVETYQYGSSFVSSGGQGNRFFFSYLVSTSSCSLYVQ